jgi:hypothetical protein
MESEDLDIEVGASSGDVVDSAIVYRALRPDEIFTLVSTGALTAPCNVCPKDICCGITANAHVNSGSRANLKSRWISTTKSLNIAALWASRKQEAQFIIGHAPGRTSGIVAVINLNRLEYLDPTTNPDIGVTAKNAALASQEILIKDKVPWSNVIGLYQAIQVAKPEYVSHTGLKTYGIKKKNSAPSYVIIFPQITNSGKGFLDYLKHAAGIGLQTRFVEAAGRRKTRRKRRKSLKLARNSANK